MKFGTKLVVFALAFLFILSFTGCDREPAEDATETKAMETTAAQKATAESQEPEEEATYLTFDGENTTKLPLTDEDITLRYWVPFKEANAKIMDSFDEVAIFGVIEEWTGIQFEFVHPPLGQEEESFKLMIASQELPDIVEMTYMKATVYPGGADQAIADGTFLKLNDLVDQYAPNYKKTMDSIPNLANDLKTDEGTLYAFQMIERIVQPAYGGPAVRGDWLEDLGMDAPVTIDDWYNMLIAFRDEKGATAPLLVMKEGVPDYYAFGGAFNVIYEKGEDFYRVDETAHYPCVEQGFKDFLTTLNKWYSEGLIDQDFLSYDGSGGANTVSKFVGGESGALSTGFYRFKNYEEAAAEVDPNFSVIGVPYPVLNVGDTCTIRQYNEHVRGDPTFVTSACEYPELAVAFIDVNYSDQGYLLCNYGIEGETYEIVDGEPQYIIEDLETSIHARHEGPFIRDYARTMFTYKPNAIAAMDDIWNGDNSGMMPKTLSMTAEEGTEFNTIMSDVSTYVQEMVPKFIMGVESLDNFDAFVQQIYDMGIEKAIKIKQASLDRYFER